MRARTTGAGRRAFVAGLAAAGAVLTPLAAGAHAAEGGMILLLPTGHYLLAGTAAVALSVVVVSAVPTGMVPALHGRVLRSPSFPDPAAARGAVSMLAFAVFAVMVFAGFTGRHDPLQNPLPSFVWTVVWTVLFFLHGLLGNLWSVLNPWSGPLLLLRRFAGERIGNVPLVRLPDRLGFLPAIVQFAAFAWFELVDLAPEDPRRLALAVTGCFAVNLAAMIVFGEAAWRARGEPFGILFALIGRLAPLGWEREASRVRLLLGWPCGRAYAMPPLPLTGVAFVLLTLSTVTFDGLSRSFVWLTAVGINPLEFPGRSAVVGASSAGLVITFAVFLASFFGAVGLGCLLARDRAWQGVAGRLVISILPIALAFQFAHYLTLALVGLQDFAVALRLFVAGGEPAHVTLSFLNDFDSVAAIFLSQAGAITLGHLVAVVLAHGLLADRPRPGRLELPFALLMIAYTAFGLWLLSTPRI